MSLRKRAECLPGSVAALIKRPVTKIEGNISWQHAVWRRGSEQQCATDNRWLDATWGREEGKRVLWGNNMGQTRIKAILTKVRAASNVPPVITLDRRPLHTGNTPRAVHSDDVLSQFPRHHNLLVSKSSRSPIFLVSSTTKRWLDACMVVSTNDVTGFKAPPK